MNISGRLKQLPTFEWEIPRFYAVTRVESETFSLKVLGLPDVKFKFIFELKSASEIDSFRYELRVCSESNCRVYQSLTVSVHVVDEYEQNHFHQSMSFDPCVRYFQFWNLNEHLLWSMGRSDLIAKPDVLLKQDDALTLLCKFELKSKMQGIEKDVTEDLLKKPCNELACLESLSQDIGKYFADSVETDVILKCRGDTFPAYKSLLSAHIHSVCKDFSSMFDVLAQDWLKLM